MMEQVNTENEWMKQVADRCSQCNRCKGDDPNYADFYRDGYCPACGRILRNDFIVTIKPNDALRVYSPQIAMINNHLYMAFPGQAINVLMMNPSLESYLKRNRDPMAFSVFVRALMLEDDRAGPCSKAKPDGIAL